MIRLSLLALANLMIVVYLPSAGAQTPNSENHWAFRPLDPGPIPGVKDTAWLKTPLDRYILSRLEKAGLRPNPAASRQALIRRVTYDLTGVPPTVDEVKAFLGDKDPHAYAHLVDRLLSSPRYGERWGRHWLDVVRYADSNDLRAIGARHDITETYRYRDWVVRSLNSDLPYNRFMMNQVAGDLLPGPLGGPVHRDGIIATGMLAFGVWGPGDSDGEKMHTDMVDDMINVTTRAFLGLTVACARCHDHKFDPISQADYYALAGVFFSSEIAPPGTSAPWVKIPLVTATAVERYNHLENQRKLAIEERKAQRAEYRDTIYQSLLETYVPETTRYLDAAYRYLSRPVDEEGLTVEDFALREDQVTAPHPGRILLMVGNADPLRSGDLEFATHLRRRGHQVTHFVPLRATAAEQYEAAMAHDIVVISESIAAASVRFTGPRSLKNVPRPILSFEPYMFPHAGWTGKSIHVDYGLTGVPTVAELGLEQLQHSLTIHPSQHAMTLGLSGQVRVYEDAYTVSWGRTGSDAHVIGSVDPAGRYPALFVYETKAKLFDGTTAPANRIGLYLGQQGLGNPLAPDSLNWGNLTRAGIALIDAAIEYSIQPDQISRPDPSVLSKNTSTKRPLRGDALAQWLDFLRHPLQPDTLPAMTAFDSQAWAQEGIYRWHTGPTTPYALLNTRERHYNVPSLVANTFYGRILYAEGDVQAGHQRYQAGKVHLTTDDGAPSDGIMSLLFRAPRNGQYDFTIQITNRVEAETKRDPFYHIIVQNKLRDQGCLRGHEATRTFRYRNLSLAAGDAVEICASGGGETFPLAVMETDVVAVSGAERWDAAKEFHSPNPGSPLVSEKNPLPGNVWEYGYRKMQGELSGSWATMNPTLFQHLNDATESGPTHHGAADSGADLNNWSTPATGRLPARSVALHPGPQSDVGVEWQAPRATQIQLEGVVQDLQAMGDGVRWDLQYRPGATPFTLAAGVVSQGSGHRFTKSAQEASLINLAVGKGDILRLILSPRENAVADITGVSLTILELTGERQQWDLSDALLTTTSLDTTQPNTPWRLIHRPRTVLRRPAEKPTDKVAHGRPHATLQRGANPAKQLSDWFLTQGLPPPPGKQEPSDLDHSLAQLDFELRALLENLKNTPEDRAAVVLASPIARLYIDLVSDTGPFRFTTRNDKQLLPPAALEQIQRFRAEENSLVNNATPMYPVAMGAREGGPKGTPYHGFNDARIHERGHYAHLGDVVPRGVPGFLSIGKRRTVPKQQSGRRQLAEWIADPANPLPARVMMNRLWLHHFGAGLVRTPGNFGSLGEAPTHPQLLDHLSHQLLHRDWSIKQMHRELLLSATYQQSTAYLPRKSAEDPTNRLWGRMLVRRLEAEAIRDTLLAVSQTLDWRMGGPVTRKREPDADALSFRRALYLMTNRSDKSGFRFLFDAADPESVVDQRTVSTVAPQSLFLMNHPFVLQLLPPMAERASRGLAYDSSDAELAGTIDHLYLSLFARTATRKEQTLGIELIRRQVAAAPNNHKLTAFKSAWQQYCQVLLCTNELIYLN